MTHIGPGSAALLLVIEEVRVGVAVGTHIFGHRVVGLDKEIATVVPRECLNAVGLLNVRFGAEIVLADAGHPP